MVLPTNQILSAVKQIPAPVKSFLWKALVFFLIWELAYNTYLLPKRIIDRPLSIFVGNSTASLINIIEGDKLAYCITKGSFIYSEGDRIFYDKAIVFLGPNRLIGIADPCNGLNLLVLFIVL